MTHLRTENYKIARIKCKLHYVICFLLGKFPGVWILIADVSEPSISSIFIGRWMKYIYFIHLAMKMELIEGSETSDIRTQTPGNYQKKTYYI